MFLFSLRFEGISFFLLVSPRTPSPPNFLLYSYSNKLFFPNIFSRLANFSSRKKGLDWVGKSFGGFIRGFVKRKSWQIWKGFPKNVEGSRWNPSKFKSLFFWKRNKRNKFWFQCQLRKKIWYIFRWWIPCCLFPDSKKKSRIQISGLKKFHSNNLNSAYRSN